jgi:hypothetical protein
MELRKDPITHVGRIPPEVTENVAVGKSESKEVTDKCSVASLCAGHAQQLGGESPLLNLMEVKG